MNKYEILHNRKERLIYLNSVYHYTQSGNPKTAQYFRILLEIRKQQNPGTKNTFNPITNPIKQLKPCKQ